MSTVTTNLGVVTAYGDAVAAGYTGTKAEWQALMASYATVAQEAQGYASNAQGYASDAQGYANNASTYAGNASSSATTATNAKTAAQTAQGLAEDAQEAAEDARDAVQASATQITTNTNAIGTLTNLTTTAKTNLVAAVNEVDADVSDLNNQIRIYQSAEFSVSSGSAHSDTNDRFAVNLKQDEKIYIYALSDVSGTTVTVNLYNSVGTRVGISAPVTNSDPNIITLTGAASVVGVYIAAIQQNATYKIVVESEESYNNRITANTNNIKYIRTETKDIADGFANFFLYTDVARGNLSDGAYKTWSKNRIASPDILTITDALTVYVASGFKVGFHYFVGGVYNSDSGWITGQYTIPANSSFRFQIARTTEDASEIADVDVFVDQVIFKTPINLNLQNEIDGINNRVEILEGYLALNPDNFELGDITINANGWTYSNSTKRVRTKQSYDLELDVGDIIRVKDPTKASLYIGCQVNMNSTGGYGATGAWVTEFVCSYGGKYAILIKQAPTEQAQVDASYLLSLLEIVKYNTLARQTNILKATQNQMLRSINHRGFNRTAPENTIPAFKLSKVYGFDFVETDISFTSDGIPVCLHDRTINRTARMSDGSEVSGDVNIDDITYDTALTYDFGLYKAERWEGTTIPTFEQLLKLAKQIGLGIYAELKSSGATAQLIKGLATTAKAYGMLSRITWISYETSWLSAILEVDPYARVGVLADSVTDAKITSALALVGEHNEVFIDAGSSTETEVNRCKTAGLAMERYCPNTTALILALPDYVTGITSDIYVGSVVNYENAMG